MKLTQLFILILTKLVTKLAVTLLLPVQLVMTNHHTLMSIPEFICSGQKKQT